MIVINARFLTQQVTGVQRFAIQISKILRKLDERLVFVTHKGVLDYGLAAELGAIVIGKNKGTLWEQVDLRNYLIAHRKPLLVNFCNTGPLFYAKQVVTIHDMSYKVNPKWFSKSFYLWYNFLIPRLANNSLKIITVSNSSKNDIISYLNISPEKVSVIYNSYYLNTNDNFGPDIGGKYLLTVSSFDARKNLDGLLRAFKNIVGQTRLIIAGLKSDKFSYALNEEKLGDKITIAGYVSDSHLASLMKNAEGFVYMSFYEGFGLPPLEAMAAGCPVIVSDIAAHREVCGAAALYANPYDIEDITEKITLLLVNHQLKEDLIAAGNQNIKRFDWFESASKVLKDINEIVEKYN